VPSARPKREFDPSATVGDGAKAVDAVVVREGVGEPHVVELLDRPRGQPVAARLLAREPLAFDEHGVEAVLGRPVGRRRARGPATDHEDVVAMTRARGGVGHVVEITRRHRRQRLPQG
jgi:hypothetical protein